MDPFLVFCAGRMQYGGPRRGRPLVAGAGPAEPRRSTDKYRKPVRPVAAAWRRLWGQPATSRGAPAYEAKLIVGDEPTGNLDSQTGGLLSGVDDDGAELCLA